MIRALYAALLWVHPRAFRDRFGDEMLCIFDQIPVNSERALLLYDAFRSFVVQWLFRTNLWIFVTAFLIALIQTLFALHPVLAP
jgi:hypothetical protein